MNRDKVIEIARVIKRIGSKMVDVSDELEASIKIIEALQFNIPNATNEELEEAKAMIMDNRIPKLVIIDLKKLAKEDFIMEISGNSRLYDVVEKRHFVHYFLRKNTKYPLKKIGSVFGKNHATVMNSEKRVESMLCTRDKAALQLYGEINECLINAGYRWIVKQPKLNY